MFKQRGKAVLAWFVYGTQQTIQRNWTWLYFETLGGITFKGRGFKDRIWNKAHITFYRPPSLITLNHITNCPTTQFNVFRPSDMPNLLIRTV